MLKKTKARIIAALMLLLLTLMLTGCLNRSAEARVPDAGEINVDLMDFQAQLMKTHPRLESGPLKDEIMADFAHLRRTLDSTSKTEDIAWALKKIVAKLGDEHTHVNVTYDQLVLPFDFRYTRDGLVASTDYEAFDRGTIITKLGTKSIPAILSGLEEVTPADHENTLLGGVLARNLKTELYLENLGVLNKDNTVDVEFQTAKGLQTVKVPLTEDKWTPPVPYEYYFDENTATGVFVIRNYMQRSEFEKTWAVFVQACQIKHPENILIDLRESAGGSEEYYFADAIFSSLGIKSYKTPYPDFYKLAFKEEEVVNVNKHLDPLDIDTLYVATSNYTVSAPSIFAATVKENNLGLVIGQPVSNNLSFYASGTYNFQHMDIQAGISGYYLEYKGSETQDDKPLQPDVYIPLYAENVRKDLDPVLEWIRTKSVALHTPAQ